MREMKATAVGKVEMNTDSKHTHGDIYPRAMSEISNRVDSYEVLEFNMELQENSSGVKQYKWEARIKIL